MYSQLKAVYEELSNHLGTPITRQSFTIGLQSNRIQISKTISYESSKFSLYCIELFNILLQQQEIYLIGSSNSTANSIHNSHIDPKKSNPKIILSKCEESKENTSNYITEESF